MSTSHSLALPALIAWVSAEALGAYMVRKWVISGAAAHRREHPDGMSLPVLLSHASLNLAGLSCWLGFVATGARAAAWLAICFLVPAIGLGISTVSIWTPYPVARKYVEPPAQEASRPRARAIPDHVLARSLDEEESARQLVDELLARNLALEEPEPRRLSLDTRALVPIAHGVLAIATFALTTLAAISAS
jgi:hypothetical protein